MALEELLTRIRGEYWEMPGLRLTAAQARRLWQLEATTCTAVLAALMEEGFLQRTSDGAFIVAEGASSSRLAAVPPSRRRTA